MYHYNYICIYKNTYTCIYNYIYTYNQSIYRRNDITTIWSITMTAKNYGNPSPCCLKFNMSSQRSYIYFIEYVENIIFGSIPVILALNCARRFCCSHLLTSRLTLIVNCVNLLRILGLTRGCTDHPSQLFTITAAALLFFLIPCCHANWSKTCDMISRADTMPTMRARSSEERKMRRSFESTKRRASFQVPYVDG